MIEYLTVDNVLSLHYVVKDHFHENTTSGKIDKNKIQSIIDKPKRKIADQEIYETVYEKAACLLEAFCREHVFADGNKRTAVLAMFTFLTINNYNMVLPFNIVKYTVEITKRLEQKPEDIETLIRNISRWIEERSSTNNKNHKKKLIQYVVLPWILLFLLQLTIIGLPIQYLILRDWFQTKMHPEYRYNLKLPLDFILIIPSKIKQIIRQEE